MMKYDSTGASDALDGIGESARDPTASQKVNPLRGSASVAVAVVAVAVLARRRREAARILCR